MWFCVLAVVVVVGLGLRLGTLGVAQALGQRGVADGTVLDELGTAEVAGGVGVQVDVLDVLGDVVGQVRLGTLRGHLDAEDGEVLDLHLVAVEAELADAGHHVLQDAVDDARGVGRVVVVHVLGELLQVVGLLLLDAAVDHAVALRRGHRVAIQIQFKHSVCVLKNVN